VSLLNITHDTKVQVRLRTAADALRRRLPQPWTVAPVAAGPHAGANLIVVFSEVLLRQDAAGGPTPDATDLSVTFLVPAVHAQTHEAATFVLRILTANTRAVPGRYRVAAPVVARRVRTLVGEGQHTTVADEMAFEGAEGTVELRLEYETGVPVRTQWPTTVRSAADPALLRVYRSDALVDVVYSEPAGVNRTRQVHLEVTDTAVKGSFDGNEALVSVTIMPWFFRKEYEAERR
jgi:hypothetical protein